jgi:hypothetical protein
VKPLGRLNSGGASFPRASATGGEWVHAPPLVMPGNGWICHAFFFPSLLTVRTAVARKRVKTKTNATSNDLFSVFFLFFQICFTADLFLFRLLLLCFRSLAVRRCCWRMGFCRVFAATAGWRDLERGNAGGGCSRWLRVGRSGVSRRVWGRAGDGCWERLGVCVDGRLWDQKLEMAGFGLFWG